MKSQILEFDSKGRRVDPGLICSDVALTDSAGEYCILYDDAKVTYLKPGFASQELQFSEAVPPGQGCGGSVRDVFLRPVATKVR
jgi:hypothetical protein